MQVYIFRTSRSRWNIYTKLWVKVIRKWSAVDWKRILYIKNFVENSTSLVSDINLPCLDKKWRRHTNLWIMRIMWNQYAKFELSKTLYDLVLLSYEPPNTRTAICWFHNLDLWPSNGSSCQYWWHVTTKCQDHVAIRSLIMAHFMNEFFEAG